MINIENESKIYLQSEERTKWFQEARFEMIIMLSIFIIKLRN